MIVMHLTKVRIQVDRPQAAAVARVEGLRRVASWVRKAQNQAIIDCPVDTGNLRGHHRIKLAEMTTKIVGTVYNDTKYAAAVHDGTKPHEIRGRRQRKPTKRNKSRGKKMLRFEINGVVIFRRRVFHPGTRPRPWLNEAGKKAAKAEGFAWSDGGGSSVA